MASEVLEKFPHNKFRRYQKETITTISKAFDGGVKYVILEAPTGSGKSPIAVALGMHYNPTYLLTSQKVLQAQYIYDYGSTDFVQLMGRGNYNCEQTVNETCEYGFCIGGGGCPGRQSCQYETAKKKALMSKIALLNYTYFLYVTNYTKIFSPVNLMVLDEGHGIDRELMSFVEIKFTQRYLSKFGSVSEIPDYDNVEDYKPWIIEVNKILNKSVSLLADEIEELRDDDSKGKDEIKYIGKLVKEKYVVESQMSKISKFLDTNGNDEWVHYYQGGDGSNKIITFKPVTIASYTDELLFKYGDRHLFMSATILDQKNFCNNLGISIDETQFFRVPSTFPLENRKIFFTNTGSMSYKDKDKTLPDIVKVVGQIMDSHKDNKGLIYTHSFNTARFIDKNISGKNKRRLVGHDGGDRGTALSYFMKSKLPKVMMSPSLSEGIDLKDDLSRFIIVCKVPFAFLGDPQIKRRKELDNNWYIWKCALTLIQVVGRGMRHENDWCDVYILDSAFKGFFIRNNHLFPDYFIKSIRG